MRNERTHIGIGYGGIRPGRCWSRTASARADEGDPGRDRASRAPNGAAMVPPAYAYETPAREPAHPDQSAGNFDCADSRGDGIPQA